MNTRFLETFVTLSQLRNFHATARALNATPAAISLRIKSLEDDLRTELVDRSAKGFRLTPSGEHLLGYAKTVVAAAAKGVGSESTLAQRETQGQIGRGAVYEGSRRVFRIGLGADADFPGEEIIDPRSGAKTGIVPDPRIGRMINRVFTNGSSPEPVQGQFAGPVKVALQTLVVSRVVLTQD